MRYVILTIVSVILMSGCSDDLNESVKVNGCLVAENRCFYGEHPFSHDDRRKAYGYLYINDKDAPEDRIYLYTEDY